MPPGPEEQTEEGVIRKVTAQVCDVSKPLMSGFKMVKAGHRIVFDEEGSYVEDKATGEVAWLEERVGMYMLKLWVKASAF